LRIVDCGLRIHSPLEKGEAGASLRGMSRVAPAATRNKNKREQRCRLPLRMKVISPLKEVQVDVPRGMTSLQQETSPGSLRCHTLF
jgi:hypothetical protein